MIESRAFGGVCRDVPSSLKILGETVYKTR